MSYVRNMKCWGVLPIFIFSCRLLRCEFAGANIIYRKAVFPVFPVAIRIKEGGAGKTKRGQGKTQGKKLLSPLIMNYRYGDLFFNPYF